jgi:hypothetical protein
VSEAFDFSGFDGLCGFSKLYLMKLNFEGGNRIIKNLRQNSKFETFVKTCGLLLRFEFVNLDIYDVISSTLSGNVCYNNLGEF